GDTVLMLENSWYSVISPEGCAAILWKNMDDPKQVEQNKIQAADALKPSSDDLIALGVVDGIIPEPLGGAHRDYSATATALKKALILELQKLMLKDKEVLLTERLNKYRSLGVIKQD
ncbi:MAG: acetyl-CoA carboxylase carboxyl transferase subunit alpha, partial [candidate division Zixibacteria bacterium]